MGTQLIRRPDAPFYFPERVPEGVIVPDADEPAADAALTDSGVETERRDVVQHMEAPSSFGTRLCTGFGMLVDAAAFGGYQPRAVGAE